ncbi:MAG: hypothetical protein GY832_04725 [Chloroflexi bacterium]|nr:hypothetical protein [Chloroflexota bacterium]
MVIGDLWVVDNLPMMEIGIVVCVPTDCHKTYRPDLLITSAAATPQSAPSPSPPGLARWCIALFPWAGGGGMRGGSWRWEALGRGATSLTHYSIRNLCIFDKW